MSATTDTASDTTTAPAHQPDDLAVLLPDELGVTVAGHACTVHRINMRELMLLVKVLMAGVGDRISELEGLDSDAEDYNAQLVTFLAAAVPDAWDEFVELLVAIVKPTDAAVRADSRARQQVREALDNPPPKLFLDVIEIVVAQEREDFEVILGKLRTLLAAATALAAKRQATGDGANHN